MGEEANWHGLQTKNLEKFRLNFSRCESRDIARLRVVSKEEERWGRGGRAAVLKYTVFFNKNVVFPTQTEYSYFSADFRLEIFLYYS